MAEDGTAFFRFDTNAGVVAADIGAAMAKIQTSLKSPLDVEPVDLNAIGSDVAALGQMFTRLQGRALEAQGEIRALMDPSRWSGGQINPQEFESNFKKIVQRSVGGIPQLLANEMALVPSSVVGRTPLAAYAKAAGDDLVNSLIGEVRKGRPAIAEALKGLSFRPGDFGKDITALKNDPVAYGNEYGRIQQLINHTRAEALVALDPKGDSPATVAREKTLGMSRLAAEVRRTQVKEVKDAEGVPQSVFTRSGAFNELRELDRLRSVAETTAIRDGKAIEHNLQVTEQQIAAQRILNEEHEKYGSTYISPTGEMSRRSAAGAVPVTNVLDQDVAAKAQAIRREQEANAALLDNNPAAATVGTYTVLEGLVYRTTKLGEEQITDTRTVARVLQQQADEAKKIADEMERSVEAARRETQILREGQGKFGGRYVSETGEVSKALPGGGAVAEDSNLIANEARQARARDLQKKADDAKKLAEDAQAAVEANRLEAQILAEGQSKFRGRYVSETGDVSKALPGGGAAPEESDLVATEARQARARALEREADAAKRYADETERAVQAARREAQIIQEGQGKFGGRYVSETGEVSKALPGGGAVAEDSNLVANQARAAKARSEATAAAREAEIANGQMLASSSAKQDLGGGLYALEGVYYRITQLGAVQLENALKTVDAIRRQAEAADKVAQAEAEAARAVQIVEENQPKVAGRYINPDTQEVSRTTRGGATEETGLKAAEVRAAFTARETEIANGQYLAMNRALSQEVSGYQVLYGEVFKVTDLGAKRIVNEEIVGRILSKQKADLEAIAVKEERAAVLAQARAGKQAAASGGLGSFLSRLEGGGESTVTERITGQIAQAGLYAFAYGALFAVQNAMRDTLKEFLDYQDSVTDLEVATRSADVVTGSWVNSLSELSRVSGSNVGAALDTAARGVRAFTTSTDSKNTVQAAGTAVETTANKLALVANKSLPDATGDTIAIGSAFDLVPDQFNQIVDAVANAKASLGGDPGQISQGLALIAGSAKEAGFNLNEAASVISLVQARTDQSGQAIATRLTRIFQILSGSTGKNLARELGVDSTLSGKDQLREYARIYTDKGTSEGTKDRITSALGGTANLRELLPLLKEYPRLYAAYKSAIDKAGFGTTEFNRKTDNLVGTLKKIAGDISNLQVDLARSDLFLPIAAGIKVLEPAIHGIDLLVKAYDELTGKIPYLQGLLGVLIDIALVSKTIAVVNAKNFGIQGASSFLSAAKSGAKGAAGVGAAGAEVTAVAVRNAATEREAAAILAAAERRAAVELRMNEVVAGSGNRRLAAEGAGSIRSGLGSLLRFVTNPKVLALGGVTAGLVAVSKISDAKSQRDSFVADERQALKTYGRLAAAGGSAAALNASAVDLRSKAGEIKESKAGWFGSDRDQIVSEMKSRARGLEFMAAQVTQEEQLAAAHQKLTVFGNGAIDTVQKLADGLDLLTAGGSTELQKLRALRRVISAPPDSSTQAFSPERLKAQIVGVLGQTLPESIPKKGISIFAKDVSDKPYNPLVDGPLGPQPATGPGAVLNPSVHADRARASRAVPLGKEAVVAIDAALDKQIQALGLDGKTEITDDQKEKLLRAALKAVDMSQFSRGGREVIDKWFKNALRELDANGAGKGSADPALLNAKHLTAKQVSDILNPSESADGKTKYPGFLAQAQAGLAAIPASDDGTILKAELKKNAAFLQSLVDKSGPNVTGQLALELSNASHAYREVAISSSEALRKAAESHAKNNRQLRAIRLRFAKTSFLVAGDDKGEIKALMESMDQQTIKSVIAYTRAAAEIARAAYLHAKSLIRVSTQILRSGSAGDLEHGGNITNPGQVDKTDKRLSEYQGLLKNLNAMEDVFANSASVPDKKAEVGAAQGVKDGGTKDSGNTAAQNAALRSQALIDPDDTVGAARAALRVAQANRAAAKTTEEKTAAIAEVVQAQDALDKALAAGAGVAANIAAAKSGGGGIATAHAALVAATGTLRGLTRGTRAYAEALPAFYQAQWQVRQAMLDYKNNLDLLRGDSTDPVEQARDALRAANRKLRSDRSHGAGRDIIAADRVAADSARNSLQADRFNQRLQDAQTAEQLGQLSFSKYITYLDHEHDRLSKIKNRTRQQQDQLNSVDEAMKSALSSMDAQFNLGDINTNGLVYQVRRFKAEAQAERAASHYDGGRHDVSQTVHINVNGADIVKVRRVIDDYLGIHGAQRRTLTRRKG